MLINATNSPPDFDSFDQYLRYIAVNFGYSSLLTLRSPKEMIEGYTDPYVMKWFIFSMLFLLGIISTCLMICYVLKYRKLSKDL